MKNKIKITIQKVRGVAEQYQIVSIKNAVALIGYGGNKDFLVGDKISRQDAIALSAYKHLEVTTKT